MSLHLAVSLLFTRLDAQTIDGHALRRGILEALRSRPGMTVGELARAFEVDYKTLAHHARVLQRAGRIVLADEGRARPCFLPGAPRVRAPAPRVVEALRAVRDGATTPAALARGMGVPRGTAGSILAALAQRGLVRRGEGGYRLSDEARAALVPDQGFSREGGFAPSWTGSSSAR